MDEAPRFFEKHENIRTFERFRAEDRKRRPHRARFPVEASPAAIPASERFR